MEEQLTFEFAKRKVIKGYPELIWTGKRPYRSTQYYPAQLKESFGSEKNGWMNKIFWGDNLQVMSHLLKDYRGKIDLIYIDPPFDSKADYKKKIQLKGKTVFNDNNTFEEKQYGDIWTNDEYLQFMYERLILIRELLSEKGSLYLHCDWHKSAHLKLLLDEVFGFKNMINEIIRKYSVGGKGENFFAKKHDTIFLYAKNASNYIFNGDSIRVAFTPHKQDKSGTNFGGRMGVDEDGRPYVEKWGTGKKKLYRYYLDVLTINDLHIYHDEAGSFFEIAAIRGNEKVGYPTQKSEQILERFIKASTNPGDLVFDCFMGSGTTQAVAMKLGRRFIGADINLGAIQTTTKRLIGVADELNSQIGNEDKYTGFEVYNVNNYEFFRNPLEAKELLIEALQINAFPSSDIFDGEKDGRMVKIMPVNRIATKADLEELIANLPYKTYERRKEENPNQPVEKISIVCMGHEADLKAAFEQKVPTYKFDIEIVDILRDKADLQFKREAEVEIKKDGNKLIIENFYPLNLMQKLSLQKEHVDNWKQLVESVMIDFNYDGAVLSPTMIDIPDKNELVKGVYTIPADSGKIKVKITACFRNLSRSRCKKWQRGLIMILPFFNTFAFSTRVTGAE